MLFDLLDFIMSFVQLLLSQLRRRKQPHVRKVLKKQGLKLTRSEYKLLCERANLTVNGKKILPNERLKTGVHIVRIYAGSHSVSYWVEVYKNKARAYFM